MRIKNKKKITRNTECKRQSERKNNSSGKSKQTKSHRKTNIKQFFGVHIICIKTWSSVFLLLLATPMKQEKERYNEIIKKNVKSTHL